jgi:hypothetical protein
MHATYDNGVEVTDLDAFRSALTLVREDQHNAIDTQTRNLAVGQELFLLRDASEEELQFWARKAYEQQPLDEGFKSQDEMLAHARHFRGMGQGCS